MGDLVSTLPRRAAASLLAVLAIAAFWPAQDAKAFETILQDDALFLHADEDGIRRALTRSRELGIDRIRVTAGWSVIAPDADSAQRPGFDAGDPGAYPPDHWRNLDRAVRLTHEAGLKPMIDIAFWAPRWATQEGPDSRDRLRMEIDAGEYARFAAAVARRYSGVWTPPALSATVTTAGPPSADQSLLEELFGKPQPVAPPEETVGDPSPLPAVDTFTIWNEPNHPGFLLPQWVKRDGEWVARSPHIYRAMVRAAYPAIKASAPGARVLVGGTASVGSSRPGGYGVPPLRFLRELACVDAELRPVTDGECAGYERLPGDGWSHHPYSLHTTPDVDTIDKDKLPIAGTARLIATLRALVGRGRIAPEIADLYLTEYGYETNGPDPLARFSPERQGALLAHAEFLATRDPAVKSWPQFQLYDRPSAPPRPGMRVYGDWQSGLYYVDGSPKPAAAVFATPVHAECASASGQPYALVWGRLRNKGHQTSAHLETRDDAGGWRTVPAADRPGATPRTASPQPSGTAVRRYVAHRPGARYRLRWTGPAGERLSPVVRPSAARCRALDARLARSAKRARARAKRARARRAQ